MKAVRVTDATPRLVDAPEPAPGPGEVLVRIEAATLSPLDLQIVENRFPIRPPEPFTPGTDACGTVVGGAPDLLDRRVWIRGAGVGLARDGCWTERAVLPRAAVHPLEIAADPVVAATFFVPCSTAWQALFAIGRLEPGVRVAVRGGSGSVGTVATQMALAAGAAEVIAVVAAEERRSTVPAGARVVVAPDAEGLERLHGERIDILVDTVGGVDLAAAIPMMAPGGRVVVVGYVAGTTMTLDLLSLLVHDVSINPLNGMNREPDSYPHASHWLEELYAGRLVLPITRFPFARLDEAIARARSAPSPGRVVLTMR